jgi:hypothetical protein
MRQERAGETIHRLLESMDAEQIAAFEVVGR